MTIYFPKKQAIIDFISAKHDPFLNSNNENVHILMRALASTLAGTKTTPPEIKFDVEIATNQIIENQSADRDTLQKIKKNLTRLLIDCATENSVKN